MTHILVSLVKNINWYTSVPQWSSSSPGASPPSVLSLLISSSRRFRTECDTNIKIDVIAKFRPRLELPGHQGTVGEILCTFDPHSVTIFNSQERFLLLSASTKSSSWYTSLCHNDQMSEAEIETLLGKINSLFEASCDMGSNWGGFGHLLPVPNF